MTVLEIAETAPAPQPGHAFDEAVGLPTLVPNILVVDDDPAVRGQLLRLYQQSG